MEAVIKLLVGLPLVYLAIRVGVWILRGLAQPLPGPPPPGEMRKVNLGYRCGVCGVELKLTASPNEAPEPPRHCMEEMELVGPAE